MKSILDPTFRYTSSVQTDLKKTFERVRRAQRAKERAQFRRAQRAKEEVQLRRAQRRAKSETQIPPAAEAGSNVLPMQRCAGSGIQLAVSGKR